jgi:uncharacterized protein
MNITEGRRHRFGNLRGQRDRGLLRLGLGLIVLSLVAWLLPRLAIPGLSDRFQIFVTIFLGIFIEAVPFLLAGSAVSGLIEVFVGQDTLARFLPRRALPAALSGALMGFAFPVCECGVVPVTRRLYQKGLPVSVGVAFLLAAPVVNPIVLLSTYAAFGWGPVLVGRLLFTIVIATFIGLLFGLARPEDVLRPDTDLEPKAAFLAASLPSISAAPAASRSRRLWTALAIGADDFLDMARYLIIGSMLAAAMQTLIPQGRLLALGQGPIISVIVMMILAFVLSICSTVDAFVALSFANTFTTGSILSFLVFGPMVDIKSALMFLGVFRRRVVVYLILLPMLLALLLGLFVNLNLSW